MGFSYRCYRIRKLKLLIKSVARDSTVENLGEQVMWGISKILEVQRIPRKKRCLACMKGYVLS